MFTDRGLSFGLLLATVLLVSAGCKQYYNGSLGLQSNDYEVVKNYHLERERKMIQREQAAAAYSQAQSGAGGSLDARLSVDPAEVTNPEIYQQQEQEEPEPWEADPSQDGNVRITPYQPRPFVSTHDVASTSHTRIPRPIDIYGDLPGERGGVSPLDSTGQVRRVSFTEEGADFDVTLDPTGQYLIYSSTRHRKSSDIYRQRIDGTAITQLTDDTSNDVMPAVSPDGKTMVFASDRSGNWDLYLMDADGGPAVQLTNDRTHDIHPSFSPDGKKLVYCSLGERSGQWQLVTIDIANPTTKRYIGHGLFPQWSPTENTILYQRARERGTRWFSVWTVALDERGEAGSPTEIVWSSKFACITPSWSPDGKAVVFCTVTNPEADTQGDKPAESDVWIARADGSGRTRMTRGRFANLQPAWSGDNAIYFVSNRATDGVENIWAIDPDDAIKVAFPGQAKDEPQTADVPTETE